MTASIICVAGSPRGGPRQQIRLTLSTNRGSENFETVHGFDLVIDGSRRSAVVHHCSVSTPSTCSSWDW